MSRNVERAGGGQHFHFVRASLLLYAKFFFLTIGHYYLVALTAIVMFVVHARFRDDPRIEFPLILAIGLAALALIVVRTVRAYRRYQVGRPRGAPP